jgi:hypothetical protein
MSTLRQRLGEYGEILTAKSCKCPKCKRSSTLRRLPPNFKCADIICDFCGFLAQVKTSTVVSIDDIPRHVLGAAWGPQKERMEAGIYFPLFLVLSNPQKQSAVYYLSADVQQPEMFKPRKPLSENARRKGWQGFLYDLTAVKRAFVRLA